LAASRSAALRRVVSSLVRLPGRRFNVETNHRFFAAELRDDDLEDWTMTTITSGPRKMPYYPNRIGPSRWVNMTSERWNIFLERYDRMYVLTTLSNANVMKRKNTSGYQSNVGSRCIAQSARNAAMAR
jgi:hypothetical protein